MDWSQEAATSLLTIALVGGASLIAFSTGVISGVMLVGCIGAVMVGVAIQIILKMWAGQ